MAVVAVVTVVAVVAVVAVAVAAVRIRMTVGNFVELTGRLELIDFSRCNLLK